MLGQRRRRWSNIRPVLDQPLVFAGDRLTRGQRRHDVHSDSMSRNMLCRV